MTGRSKLLGPAFSFSAEEEAKLLDLVHPSDEWLRQFDEPLLEMVGGASAMVIGNLEACAKRFLRGKVQPVSSTTQRKHLQALEYHAGALLDLITRTEAIAGTIADPFYALQKIEAKSGREFDAFREELHLRGRLMMMQMFAKARLMRNLQPDKGEERVEKAKRRTTFPRFVLLADLSAAYTRITGKEPAATAHRKKNSEEYHPSEAVEFLRVASTAILRAGRQTPAEVDYQVLRKELAEIKSMWADGLRPELQYALPHWGKEI